MNTHSLLVELQRRGVILEARGDRLFFWPVDAVPDDLLEHLREQKTAVLARLRSSSGPGTPLVDEDGRVFVDGSEVRDDEEVEAAVLIRSELLGGREVWIALSDQAAAEVLAEEQSRPNPRPVLRPEDLKRLEGRPAAMLDAALNAAVVWPGKEMEIQ